MIRFQRNSVNLWLKPSKLLSTSRSISRAHISLLFLHAQLLRLLGMSLLLIFMLNPFSGKIQRSTVKKQFMQKSFPGVLYTYSQDVGGSLASTDKASKSEEASK